MAENHVDIKRLFLGLQKQMLTRLATARECIPHQGSKGDAAEECWRLMLCEYLPKRYNVKKAFVIDSTGVCSEQIDIVIFDQQYSPFLFNQDGAYYVPAESVYGVIEAKQEINKEMIKYAGAKAASVRKLKRTNGTIHWAQGPMKRRELHEIPAGIVSLTSGWSPALGEPLGQVLGEIAMLDGHRLDFGCVLEAGAFDVKYGEPTMPEVDRAGGDIALISFFLRLIQRLQQLGTAPAIDIPEYLKALEPIEE
jgi:hypothetical protein